MEEKDLVEKSQKGDQEAFAELMRKYEQRIFNSCLRILHDVERAQDVVQEVFLIAYEKIGSFEKRSSFYTWLYRIARNRALNTLRKLPRGELSLKEEITSAAVSPQEIEMDEKMEVLKQALEVLTPKQRLIFERFEFEKKAQKEIAAELNIPPGTVRSALFYARLKVRKRIEEKKRQTI